MADSKQADELVDVLGGAQVLKCGGAGTRHTLRDLVNEGLPYKSFEIVRERLELSVPEAAALLRVPERTLARRKTSRRLAADESDRLYRVARILARASNVFGDDDKAVAWLRRPNRSLRGETPLRQLDSDLGAHEVEEILGRIEHGIVG